MKDEQIRRQRKSNMLEIGLTCCLTCLLMGHRGPIELFLQLEALTCVRV